MSAPYPTNAALQTLQRALYRAAKASEPLPGDPDEAQQGSPPPIPDPPDTDPVPEDEPNG